MEENLLLIILKKLIQDLGGLEQIVDVLLCNGVRNR